MKLTELKTNRIVTPLGFTMQTPTLSWVVQETAAKRQSAAQVVVSLREDLTQPVFDTGKSAELSSLGVACTAALLPCTRYYWGVTVWADNGETAKAASWFETGKQQELWAGKWITAPFEKGVHSYLVRPFVLKAPVKRARLYCTGLGMYEASVNGKKAGDEYLAPGCNDYENFIQAQTYDVTALVQQGENRLGMWLGKGWYAGRFGLLPPEKTDLPNMGVNNFGDELKLLAELRVELTDGSTVTVASDESWLCAPSPVTESGIYNGEWYDARLEKENWCVPGTELSGWKAALAAQAPEAPVVDRWSLPVKIMQRLPRAELIHTPAGETVLDFHQEMTGWVEFDCDVPEGTTVQLQCGELLQHGSFYNENLRSALAQYTYISNGKKARVRPHFTFYGFRYIKVTGLPVVDPAAFEACVLYSAMQPMGTLETSNPKVNRLVQNAIWGQKGNFVDVPTDCPQRDERLGWTGDAEVFCGTASFNMDTAAFYAKYLHDMLLEQNKHRGAVPHVVPDMLCLYERKMGVPETNFGSCAWGDAGAIIPWNNYLFYGDKTQLAREYQNMKAWVDYIKSRDEEVCGGRRLWLCDFQFGDWLAMDNPDKASCFGGTDSHYIASGYYYWSARLTAKAAAALGKTQEAEAYNRLAEEIREAFRKEYFTSTGRLAVPTQTALAMALYMGLAPEAFRQRQIDDLQKRLDDRKGYLDTGFVGTYQLCYALAANGHPASVYTLLLNEELPSWLYEVNMGATTIWERWNSVLPDGLVSDTGMNSLNHYSYGAVLEWMYRFMCGLNPSEEAPGFKKVHIRTVPDDRLEYARAEYHSAAGTYVSGWKKIEGGFAYEIQVPFDAQASFEPARTGSSATVNGRPSEVPSAEKPLTLTAGSYCIEILE